MVECIVLAGGFGTRLKECVPDLPKVLAPINNIPLLDLLVKQLSGFKIISKITLALGYKADVIQSYCQKNFTFPIQFSIETTPLGTGGALKQALDLCTEDTVLVLNGDSYLDFDFEKLIKGHTETKADITLIYTKKNDVSRYGQVILDPQEQRILAFKEKIQNQSSQSPQAGFISCGFYLMKRTIFQNLDLEKSFSLEKVGFPLLLKNRFFGHFCEGLFIDIGTKTSYSKAHKILAHL